MIIHIVRPGENIGKILNHYGITHEELVGENQHLSDFLHIKPGTKLRIPLINAQTLEILEETEPFVEEYYPKPNAKEIIEMASAKPQTDDAEIEIEEKNNSEEENNTDTIVQEKKKDNRIFYHPRYGYIRKI